MLVSCHATFKSQVCLSLLDAHRDRDRASGYPECSATLPPRRYWWHMQGRARQAPQPAGRHPRSHVPSLGNTDNISELRCGNLALSMQHESRHELMYYSKRNAYETHPRKWTLSSAGHSRFRYLCYDGHGNLRSCRFPDEMHSTLIEQSLLCQGVVVPWTTERPHIMQNCADFFTVTRPPRR